MNIKQIKKILLESGIEPKIELNEAKIEAKMLVKHFLGLSDKDLILNPEFEAKEEDLKKLLGGAKLRAEKRIPIQHIIGLAHFMGEDFIVNENVLIPRDETELLIRKAVEIINGEEAKGQRGKEAGQEEAWKLGSLEALQESKVKPPNFQTSKPPIMVLDIGTGSGCIACMIAKLTDAQVLGVDISTSALQIALENSSKLGLNNKAIFRKSDIYSNVDVKRNGDEKFDLIISNPPYIPIKEKNKLQKEVLFEPKSALFAQDIDGIEFYEKITTKAPEFLNEGGCLIFELGIGQAKLVQSLMEKNNFKNIKTEKDLAGIERIIWGEWMRCKDVKRQRGKAK